MALLTSNDNGVSWDAPRPLLTSSSGQFDAQIKVDPVDRETLYASWLCWATEKYQERPKSLSWTDDTTKLRTCGSSTSTTLTTVRPSDYHFIWPKLAVRRVCVA
jgi:hypothetical protein